MGTVKVVNAEHNINIQSDHIYKHIVMSKQMQKKNDNNNINKKFVILIISLCTKYLNGLKY